MSCFSAPPLRPRSSQHAFARSDTWSVGDACVVFCPGCRCLAIYIHNTPVRLLAGLMLDQASIDSRLQELRTRPKR